jgi:hypothetical protein
LKAIKLCDDCESIYKRLPTELKNDVEIVIEGTTKKKILEMFS